MPSIAGRQRARYRQLVASRRYRYARITLVFVGLFPWWLPLLRAYLPLGPLGEIFDQLFVVVCHRVPARTITLSGVLMPLCTRCAGIFGGLALAGMFDYPRVSKTAARWWLLLAGLLMLSDVLRQDLYRGGVMHPLRIATGVMVGFAAALSLLAALRPGEPQPRRN